MVTGSEHFVEVLMAGSKTTEFPTDGEPPDPADVIGFVDVSAGRTEKMTVAELAASSAFTNDVTSVNTLTGDVVLDFATSDQGALADSALQSVVVPDDITATGTPSDLTYLRGDGTWSVPAAVDLNDAGIAALVDDAGSDTSAALDAQYALPNAAYLTDVTITAIDDTTDPTPIDTIDGVLYGRTVSPVTLWSSTDNGDTWSSVEVFGATSAIISLLPLGDGEVLLNRRADGLYKSSGWATNPATATWSNILTPSADAYFLAWGTDTDPSRNLVIAAEYAVNPRNPSDGLWVSTDDGDTFTKVRSLNTEWVGAEDTVHWHGVAIDRVNGRLWASYGDGNKQLSYSDNNGTDWTELSDTKQPTVLVGTTAGVVMGTDETPDGMMFVERTTTPADMVITQPFTARYLNTGGLVYQVQRGVRVDTLGGVVMAAAAQSADAPGAIWFTPDGGRAGWELYTWEAEGNIAHICIDADDYIHAYAVSVDTADYVIRGKLIRTNAFVQADPGGALGGSAPSTLGVAVGGGSTAVGGGTSVGVGSTTENKGVAIGADASGDEGVAIGADSAAISTSGVAIGRTATVSGTVANATAVGFAAAASQNKTTAIGDASVASADRATALGRNAQAAYSDSVAIGADSIVTAAKQVKLDDRHIEMVEITDPTAPAANGARLYVRDNGSGKTQIVVRFNTGAIQVIATEP